MASRRVHPLPYPPLPPVIPLHQMLCPNPHLLSPICFPNFMSMDVITGWQWLEMLMPARAHSSVFWLTLSWTTAADMPVRSFSDTNTRWSQGGRAVSATTSLVLTAVAVSSTNQITAASIGSRSARKQARWLIMYIFRKKVLLSRDVSELSSSKCASRNPDLNL